MMTEDAEMELLAMAIPGSFTTEWDVDEWESVWKVTRSEKSKNRMDPCSQVLTHDRPSPASPRVRIIGSLILPAIRVL